MRLDRLDWIHLMEWRREKQTYSHLPDKGHIGIGIAFILPISVVPPKSLSRSLCHHYSSCCKCNDCKQKAYLYIYDCLFPMKIKRFGVILWVSLPANHCFLWSRASTRIPCPQTEVNVRVAEVPQGTKHVPQRTPTKSKGRSRRADLYQQRDRLRERE